MGAQVRQVSPDAPSCLLFLYREVLRQDIGNVGNIPRAKQPVRLPVVLTRDEVRAVLGKLQGVSRIAGVVMYGGGLFGALCGQLGLRHHWTRPYRPQTNGKAERFIRTCLAEWAYQRSYPTSGARASTLRDFLRYYNQDRFHMGINGLTPMQRLAQHR